MTTSVLTDWQRIVLYLEAHPGSSRGEMQAALGWAFHVTARLSDARAHGVSIHKWKDGGVWRYRVEEPRPKPVTGEQMTWGGA